MRSSEHTTMCSFVTGVKNIVFANTSSQRRIYPLPLTEPVFKQDRQCMYNVILRHVRVTIVALEKQ